MTRNVSDAAVARRLIPVLAASALGLVPFTVFSTFLVEIAESVGEGATEVGALRGLGGLAAIVIGAIYAAVAAVMRPRQVASVALLLLAGVSVLGTGPGILWVVAFCIGTGAATALLNPALQTAAAANFESEAARGRAATMVTATTTATAVLAAPVLGGLSFVAGWQGVLWITAILSVIVAIVLQRMPNSASTADSPRQSRRALGAALRDRTIQAPLIMSGLRTCGFMGALAVVAAVYAERHGLSGAAFTPVWTLSGASFLVGNWFSGKVLAARDVGVTLVVGGVVLSLAGGCLIFITPEMPTMLIGTSILAIGHSMIAAAVTTSIARSRAELRSAAFAVNGVLQSAGTFLGPSLAALGFMFGGWPGVAVVLSLVTIAVLLWVPRFAAQIRKQG